jgi:tetratricopeptide (TPR) repeat protein
MRAKLQATVLCLMAAFPAMGDEARFNKSVEMQGAETAMTSGDYQAAYTHYQRLSYLEPNNAEWFALAARAQMRRGKLESAEAKATAALDVDAKNITGLLVMGEIRSQQQLWTQAKAFYSRAVDADGNSASALAGLAVVEQRLGNDEAAEAASQAEQELGR